MTSEVRIKKCSLEDLKDLTRLAKNTFCDTFAEFNDPVHFNAYVEKAFSLKQIKKELLTRGSSFYLISYKNQLAGYLKLNEGVAQSDINDPESLEIERIYLDQRFQGQGLGKDLFELSLQKAVEQKAKYIWLGVWEHNTKALAFYKARGFYKFDEHPFKLGDDLQTDYLMRLDL